MMMIDVDDYGVGSCTGRGNNNVYVDREVYGGSTACQRHCLHKCNSERPKSVLTCRCRRPVVDAVRDADAARCYLLVPLKTLGTPHVDRLPAGRVFLTRVVARTVALVLHVPEDVGDSRTAETGGWNRVGLVKIQNTLT